MSDITLFSALQAAATLNKADTGFRYLDRHEKETWRNFPDLASKTAAIAGGLYAAGVRPGDTVAIVLPTTVAFTDVFFAAVHMGAIPIPLYPPVRLGRLDEYFSRTTQMLNQAKAKVLVTDARAGKLMGSVVAATDHPVKILRVAALEQYPPLAPTPAKADDVAMVQFSSGTTGAPKPVALTHAHVIANASAILDIEPDDDNFYPAGVTWLPLYHDMGLIGCIFPTLLYPGSLTLLPPEAFLAKPALWLRAISKYKAFISPAPNFAYALCTERIQDDELHGVDLSHWRFALNGAEPTSANVMRAFTKRFAPWGLRSSAMTPVYGLSEASLAVTFGDAGSNFIHQYFCAKSLQNGEAKPDKYGVELASVGRPLRGFSIQIRGQEGCLADGKIGRLWVAGPSIMDEYLDGSPAPKDGEWLDTGDLGFIFEDELYIAGRAKDVLVVHGRNHDPSTLESAVNGIEGVRTGCAAAVADITGDGEAVLLFVETRGQVGETLAERCKDAVMAKTGVRTQAIILLQAGTLPRTSSGKIRRGETLKQWRDGTLVPPKPVNAFVLAGAVVKSTVAQWRRNDPKHHD